MADSFAPDNTPPQSSSEQKRFYYLAQEYVEGENLQQKLEERLRNGEAFSEEEGFRCSHTDLDILKYLHAEGILHLDIKPLTLFALRKTTKTGFS
jgi:serine/threonine-protein kinase